MSVDVFEEAHVLEIKFGWPNAFMRPERLCAAFIADKEHSIYNENHIEVIALEKELKNVRTAHRLARSKPISSKTSI